MIFIYTDGGLSKSEAFSKEGGVGAWSYILLQGDKVISKTCKAETNTTNNRMELIAAIEALEALKKLNLPNEKVELITDSLYLKNGITIWTKGWERNDWKTSGGEPVKNKELWLHLMDLDKVLKPKYSWVKGHSSGNKAAEHNSECDKMCQEAIAKKKKELGK